MELQEYFGKNSIIIMFTKIFISKILKNKKKIKNYKNIK